MTGRSAATPVIVAALGVAALVALGVQRQLRPIARGDLRVGASPLRLPLSPPRELAGPVRQLCLAPAGASDARMLSAFEPSIADRPMPDRPVPDRWVARLPIVAVLIRTSGERDTLGGSPRETANGGAIAHAVQVLRTMLGVCLSDRGLADLEASPAASPRASDRQPPTTTYQAVELRSTVPIRLRAVSLWAGRPTAAP